MDMGGRARRRTGKARHGSGVNKGRVYSLRCAVVEKSSHVWSHGMVVRQAVAQGCLKLRMCQNANYQLPNGLVKAGRRWGQRHPQGANLGIGNSTGKGLCLGWCKRCT